MRRIWNGLAAWSARWERRARHLLGRGRAEQEMAEEFRLHVELEIEQNLERGMSPEDARRQALRTFGGVERYKEQARAARGTRWLEDFASDLRYGVRKLRRSPGFASVAVMTLALGIGATTAIFSVVNGVIFRPLPFEDPAQLVWLYTTVPDEAVSYPELSPPNIMSLREEVRAFTDVVAFQTPDVTLTGAGAARRLEAAAVSGGFFELLGVQPVLGRTFRPDENESGNHRVVILGHGPWQRLFGGDPEVVGRTITLNGSPFMVVGVMPAGFSFPEARAVWIPKRYNDLWSATTTEGRKGAWVPALARLRPGVSLDAARAELEMMGRRLALRFPKTNTVLSFTAVGMRDEIVGQARTPLLLLLGSVVLVLFIACANVVGLLLARGAARRAELAARAAFGAGRGRLVRQLLAESLLLGLVGGALGLAVAVLGTEVLLAVRPEGMPRLDEIQVDGTVLAFATGVTLLAVAVVGLVPGLEATRGMLSQSLRAGGRNELGSQSGTRFRAGLVVSEIALAVVLLAGAGFLMRSFFTLIAVDPGFRAERVLTFALAPSGGLSVYDDGEEIRAFYDAVIERVTSLPGVQAVGAVSRLPIVDGPTGTAFGLEGEPPPQPGEPEPLIGALMITPEYLRTMAIPVLRGRGIADEDRAGAFPVVVINQAAAEEFFAGVDPVGKRLVRFRYDPVEQAADAFTIVGVVGNVQNEGLSDVPTPTAYFAHAQVPMEVMSVVVRTAGDPLALTRAIRAEVQTLDPNLAIPQFTTLEQVLGDSVSRPRFVAALLGLFAAVALALAAIGIFGLLSFAVAQQTREIGIRIALGARSAEVLWKVVGRALRLAGIGLGLGLLGALALTRFIESVLFGASATDPATYVGVAAVLGATVLLASLLPARRAAAVDPMMAIRHE